MATMTVVMLTMLLKQAFGIEALLAVALSCALGVCLSVSAFHCRRQLDATSYSVIGNMNKVLTVLAVLCDEISEIKVTAQSNFYPAMVMFGQPKHGDEEDLREGEGEAAPRDLATDAMPGSVDTSSRSKLVARESAPVVSAASARGSPASGRPRQGPSAVKFLHCCPVTSKAIRVNKTHSMTPRARADITVIIESISTRTDTAGV